MERLLELRKWWHSHKITIKDLGSRKNHYHLVWECFECFDCKKDCKKELEILKQYEPNKYAACMNLFKKSYELKDKKGGDKCK